MAPTYRQHEKRMHRLKSRKVGYFKPKSRKKFRMTRRVAVRDSKRVY
ncbi:hypothetical protein GQ600_19754 [Phytophthora cactorum]|nr:hypothetical protein GQ600_19754 [Phytophthora cactorum]